LMSTGRGPTLPGMLPPLENRDPGDETVDDDA